MRNVVFVAPFFMEITLRFLEAAARHPGVRLAVVSQEPAHKLPAELRQQVVAYRQIRDSLHPAMIAGAVEDLRRELGPIHRILGTLEHIQVQLAQVREHLGIEGMGVEAARNFRDKSQMKNVLREAGLPCARHRLVGRPEDAWAFVEQVGLPIVIKPPEGVGAKATYAIETRFGLEEALQRHPPHPEQPLLAEEFVQGAEHSFDAVMLRGRMVWHSLTRYYPTPLEVTRNPWIQWCVLLPREIDAPEYDDVRLAGAQALRALGLETGVCHMEWFRRPDGSLAISEIAARPGGAQISKLMSYAHDFHFYRAWAGVMIDGVFTPPERRFAAGAVFLRGQGQGRVQRIRGLGQAQQELGPLVVEAHLPQVGQPQASSYEGEGYVILRHRETEVVKRALHRMITLIRVELG
ncbi:MAG: ATP-grasp domain-containing protein [Thermoanaerobaculia bacterium]|nr:ATP-grasp domain-containing protein [Thermoanaerobaculia bacterium]